MSGESKDYIKAAIYVVGALVLALIIIERSCPRSNAKYIKLKGQYETHKEKIEEEKEILMEEIKKKDNENLKKDEEIKKIKEDNLAIDEERIKLKKKDREKADKIRELKEERESLTDQSLIIANQDLLIKEWEARFWNEREDKEKVIKQRNAWAAVAFKQHGKYQNEHSLRKMLEKQLAGQEALTDVGEEIAKVGEKRMAGLNLKFTLGNILYTGLGFGLGYLLGATR